MAQGGQRIGRGQCGECHCARRRYGPRAGCVDKQYGAPALKIQCVFDLELEVSEKFNITRGPESFRDQRLEQLLARIQAQRLLDAK